MRCSCSCEMRQKPYFCNIKTHGHKKCFTHAREKIMYIPSIFKIITNLGINLLEYFIIKSLISLKKWSSLFQFFVYIQTLAQLISKCRNHSSRKKCLLIVTLKDLHIFSPLLILQRRNMSIFFFFFLKTQNFPKISQV